MSTGSASPRALKVFLCHGSEDKPQVRALYQRLRTDGIQPWLDEEDILPGQDWDAEIRKAVRANDIILVCLSRTSVNKSGYLQKEIKFALDVADEKPPGTIFLIPLKLEECEVPERFRIWQWVNLFEERGYERLMRALQAQVAEIRISLGSSSSQVESTDEKSTIEQFIEDEPPVHIDTDTTAFIGYAKSGEFHQPTLVTSWDQFCQIFSEEANILLRGLCDELGLTGTQVLADKQNSRKPWPDYARSVLLQAIRVGNAKVKGWKDFLRKYQVPQSATPYIRGCYLAHAVHGYFDNGGKRVYIIRVPRVEDVEVLKYRSSGSLSSYLRADDFLGDEPTRTGIASTLALDDISIICVPDLMAEALEIDLPSSPNIDYERYVKRRSVILDIQRMLIAHCERMGDRIVILDPLPALTPQEMIQFYIHNDLSTDTGQAAVYYPWINVRDPLRDEMQIPVPPSGHIAGVWAQVGSEKGVQDPPANQMVRGAMAVQLEVTRGEQEILIPWGINIVRSWSDKRVGIWGARTLAAARNPSWREINVRRVANYIKKLLERSLSWVVYQRMDPSLCDNIHTQLSALLMAEWKSGKLSGTIELDAFYVKCDAEINTQEILDTGRVRVEVGVSITNLGKFRVFYITINEMSGVVIAEEGFPEDRESSNAHS